jgi:hypothetical protein
MFIWTFKRQSNKNNLNDQLTFLWKIKDEVVPWKSEFSDQRLGYGNGKNTGIICFKVELAQNGDAQFSGFVRRVEIGGAIGAAINFGTCFSNL